MFAIYPDNAICMHILYNYLACLVHLYIIRYYNKLKSHANTYAKMYEQH